jgi:hypothetical protein
MAMSNTSILIKRSQTTGKPTSLNQGELAYSYLSNTLFFGTVGGNGVVNVGGQYYTSTVDAATNANTASTLVKRDTNGAFYGQLYGNANTATTLQNSQNFSVSGGDITASAVGFNGSSGVTLNASLNNVNGLSSGSVGSSTSIPVIQYGANGRILAVSSAAIATSFTASDGVNSNTVNGGSTLTFKANSASGITTAVNSNETVYFGVDNTLLRSNTTQGAQTVSSDLLLPSNSITVGGTITAQNLAISGNITFANAISTLNITDPMIYLAANNSGNLVDIGMVGRFVGTGHTGDTSHYQHTGFVRDYTDNKWKLFSNVAVEPTTTVTFDSNSYYDVIKVGGVDASGGNITAVNAITANSLTLSTALPIASGGTNSSSYGQNGLLFYNGTSFLTSANVTAYTSNGSSSYVPVISTNALGQVTSISNTAIAIDTSQIVSGTLPLTRGGTGATSFTNGQIIIGNGTTSLISLANSSYSNTGTYGANTTLSTLTIDAYGRVTAAAWQAISGLTVSQGGTGQSSFTTNGLTYGNGSGALQVTAAAGTSDQTWSNQIMTVTNSGVPTWTTTMDGGTF